MNNNHFFSSKSAKIQKYILIISIFLINVFSLSANDAYVAQTNLTIRIQNKSIKDVFNQIESQSEFIILYEANVLDLTKKVTLNISEQPVSKVLDRVLVGEDATYTINDRQIIIKKSTESIASQTKTVTIRGTIFDENGETIIGANIFIKGKKTGTISDFDGKFVIEVPASNAALLISYIGYVSQEVKIKNQKEIKITLKENTETLDEVVIVGYGTQRKESVVGSVQMVKPGELKVPSSNLSSGFAGRLAGVVAMQRSGEPGADGADFWIRGISTFNGSQSPLIIIDGVQGSSADLNSIDPEVIEGFSVLKDATATALYGSRGANGVMIVTTKSGRDLEKTLVNFRVENSYSMPTQTPKFVNGVRYMEMYNEAIRSRGTGEVLYSDDKIDGTRMGGNPYVFPNVNWYDELFESGSMNQNANFNVRGGNKKIDYFSSVSVNHDSGILKNTDDFSYDSNINLMRYVFQNNINVSLSRTSKLSLRLNVQLRDYSGPVKETKDLFGLVMEGNPVDFPIRYPQNQDVDYIQWGGKSGGAFNNGYRNPYAEMASGYKSDFQSTVMSNLKFEQKLDFITEGLSADILFSFKNWTQTNTSRTAGYNQFEVPNYTVDADGNITDFTRKRVGAEQSTVLNTSNSTSGDRRIYLQGMINYNRTFARVHNVSGMLLYNQDEYNVNNPDGLIASLPQRKQGFAGRATYAYDYRYLAEFNFGYNGSENFGAGNRFGFFPSVGLGYVISSEPYFKKFRETITNLKLRASWGLVGNDQIGGDRYLYLSDIELESDDLSYTTGKDQNVDKKGPKYKRYANPDITWEVGSKWNLGLELGIKNAFNLNFDMFHEVRSNIFMERQSIPGFLGTSPADKWIDLKTKIFGNLGKVQNQGFDFSVDYFKQFNKDFQMSLKGTFTFAQNKVLEYDEPSFQKYPNLSRVGHSINQELLYTSDRLFIDYNEVLNSPSQKLGGWVTGGDIKYINLPDADGNYDNVIDSNDRSYSGMPTVPEIVYGFGPSFRYKKFDFSFFMQGVARTSIRMEGIHPFGTDGTRSVQQFIADDYWSANDPNIYASYPRLSKQDNDNNTAKSTFWQRNGAFLKLKNAELGYNHKSFRVYLRGSNLLTFSEFKEWDPEQGSGSGLFYPTQRVFNLGIQLTLNK